ncbi:MAG TPA: hypothetical protein VHG28_21640 [Longimicrobiaceae bacterium]|nr:hypothetical protein [Longimicrobiaceae bacterium]
MSKRNSRLLLRCLPAIGTALGLLSASGCSEPQAITPSTRVAASTSAAPAAREIVVLRPVMIEDEDGTRRTEHQPRVVSLRPVMIGEAVDLPQN